MYDMGKLRVTRSKMLVWRRNPDKKVLESKPNKGRIAEVRVSIVV